MAGDGLGRNEAPKSQDWVEARSQTDLHERRASIRGENNSPGYNPSKSIGGRPRVPSTLIPCDTLRLRAPSSRSNRLWPL